MIQESTNQAIKKAAYKNSKEEIKNREKQNDNNDNELNK